MNEAAALLTAASLGAMIFFSFIVAPLVFRLLPEEPAGKLIRGLFPWYFGVLMTVTFGAAVVAMTHNAIASLPLIAVALGFVLHLAFLMPGINAARDLVRTGDTAAQHHFKMLHGTSVALNLLQIGLLTYMCITFVASS